MDKRFATASAVAAAAIGVVAGRGFARFAVAEESMAPALLPGDYLIARRRRTTPQRSDVVIFEHPHRRGFHLIKRVVGLPGDTVTVDAGRVLIGGTVLEEPWADGPTLGFGSWHLEAEEVFVLGDARATSADDSRVLGPIALGDIEWRAVLRYWPLPRAGRPAVSRG